MQIVYIDLHRLSFINLKFAFVSFYTQVWITDISSADWCAVC